MTVPDSVFESLCDLIAAGSLLTGQRLPPERKLALMLGVSRASVREALRTLDSLGLIETRSGSGSYLIGNAASFSKYFVRRQTARSFELRDMLEARICLECEVVSLAARRITDEGKEALKALIDHMEKLEDSETFLNADFAFHELIARISTNFFLLEMLKSVRELMLEFNMEVIKRPGQRLVALEFHRGIYHALAEGDPDKSRLAMLRHLESIREDETAR
ncbi:MAG: FadR family transcriptional regulator [Methylobacteriaceae bacterium]|nr:FadR family transcriptional regulator [Methylobacteriaceae bacterium]